MIPGIVCCKNCSKQLPAAASFCRRCGWRTAGAAPAGAAPASPQDVALSLRAMATPTAARVTSPAKLAESPEESAPTLDDLRPAPLNWLFKLLDPSVWFVALAAGVVLTLDGCLHRSDQPRGLRGSARSGRDDFPPGPVRLARFAPGPRAPARPAGAVRDQRDGGRADGTPRVRASLADASAAAKRVRRRAPSPSDESQGTTGSLPENGMWRPGEDGQRRHRLRLPRGRVPRRGRPARAPPVAP